MTEDGTLSILVQPAAIASATHRMTHTASSASQRRASTRLASSPCSTPAAWAPADPAGLRGTAGRTDGHPPASLHAGAVDATFSRAAPTSDAHVLDEPHRITLRQALRSLLR